MKAYDTKTGREVKGGDEVADFRGTKAVFLYATRANEAGRDGKVCVRDGVGPANAREMYARVYGLEVH